MDALWLEGLDPWNMLSKTILSGAIRDRRSHTSCVPTNKPVEGFAAQQLQNRGGEAQRLVLWGTIGVTRIKHQEGDPPSLLLLDLTGQSVTEFLVSPYERTPPPYQPDPAHEFVFVFSVPLWGSRFLETIFTSSYLHSFLSMK